MKKTDPALFATLNTDRLRLEPLSAWQAAALTWRHWACDPEMHEPLLLQRERLRRLGWWRRILRGYGRSRIVHAIIPHGSNEPVGLHLIFLKPWRTAGLQVALHDRAWWGKDVVFETRTAILTHIFDGGLAARVEAIVLARNISSIYTYRRLGFTHSGTAHRSVALPDGSGGADVVTFELLSENWQGKGP